MCDIILPTHQPGRRQFRKSHSAPWSRGWSLGSSSCASTAFIGREIRDGVDPIALPTWRTIVTIGFSSWFDCWIEPAVSKHWYLSILLIAHDCPILACNCNTVKFRCTGLEAKWFDAGEVLKTWSENHGPFPKLVQGSYIGTYNIQHLWTSGGCQPYMMRTSNLQYTSI